MEIETWSRNVGSTESQFFAFKCPCGEEIQISSAVADGEPRNIQLLKASHGDTLLAAYAVSHEDLLMDKSSQFAYELMTRMCDSMFYGKYEETKSICSGAFNWGQAVGVIVELRGDTM